MAKLSMRGKLSIDAVAAEITEAFAKQSFSCELVESVMRQIDEVRIYVLVFDKYYMRVKNRASLTVVLTGAQGEVLIDAISSGGGAGALFRFSWGAEEDFLTDLESFLMGMGFSRA